MPAAWRRLSAGRRMGPEQAVDRLVHRSVAAEREHQAITVPGGGRCDGHGVAPVACLDNLEVELRGQRVHNHIPAHLCGRGGVWVDDKERAHVHRLECLPGAPGQEVPGICRIAP